MSEHDTQSTRPRRSRFPLWAQGVSLAREGQAAMLALIFASAVWLAFGGTEGIAPTFLGGLMLGLSAAVLLVLWLMGREIHHVTDAVRRFARRLGRDDIGGAVNELRRESGHGPSILEHAASEVGLVLGERERRWRARMRLSADWYWETDTSLQLSLISEDLSTMRHLGLRPESLIGHRLDQIAVFAAPEGGWGALNERVAQRKSFRAIEFELLRPGQTASWVAISGRPRRGPQGQFAGYEGIGRDVTERRLAFNRLRESEQRYAVMVSLSSDWYWEDDVEHRFTYLGALGQEMFGSLALQALGAQRWEFTPEGASAESWAAHRADLTARRGFNGFEFLLRVPGRGVRWVSLGGMPQFDAVGDFQGYRGVGRDITLRKRAEKMLLTRNAQLERLVAGRTAELEQSNRDLDAFARQLAHELRTPIGHVIGLNELLRSKAGARLQDDELKWLQLQAQSAQTMSHTVTALLEHARTSSSAIELDAVDLSALAREVVRELPAIERRAPVQWEVADGLHAQCGAALMRVVLLNLLGNAAKFTRDMADPRVEFGWDDGVFYVQDNGAGFDAQRAATLFQPFVRLHRGEQFQGTGLGLSIVRRIVERHGGAVSASGNVGQGARFEFSLQVGVSGDAPSIEVGDSVS